MAMSIQTIGNIGTYSDGLNVFTFQLGDTPQSFLKDDISVIPYDRALSNFWYDIDSFHVLSRGMNNRLCEEITDDIKNNRLLPQLIRKQTEMLYGHGPVVFRKVLKDGKLVREYTEQDQIMEWMDSWINNGVESSYTDFAYACIKNMYTFNDFFVKWRIAKSRRIGRTTIAGLECMENKDCRLATKKPDYLTDLTLYRDFRYVLVGNCRNITTKYRIYPKFNEREVDSYEFAAVSHHRKKSVGDFYGCNETYEGTKGYIRGANETPEFINSFLKNSLAAKVHIIVPNAWVESKKKQIKNLCEENKKRKSDGKELLTYNNIEIGTEYKESVFLEYFQAELKKMSDYLSGAPNQGKAISTISFRSGNGNNEEQWKFETLDLKYKEYISSLIEYDKRADEVLLSSLGMDASISSISKDGVISKSGADVYYNYLIYILGLFPDDEKCSEPFNMAIKINFPDLYKEGYRIGYYREIPARQEAVSPDNRLYNQQP
jgi:hypothetical protein